MRTIRIVQMDSLMDGQVNLGPIDKALSQVILVFENTDEAFGEDVVVAVTDCAHAGLDLVTQQGVHVQMAGVLDTMIAMMDQGLRCDRVVLERHLQAGQGAISGQRVRHMAADDETGKQIHEQEEIGKATNFQFQVGNVTHPDLVRAGDRHPGQQVWSSPPAWDSSPSVGSGALNQQILAAQHLKQAIAANLQAFGSQHRLYFEQQLTTSHPWMLVAHLPYQFQDNFISGLTDCFPAALLVVSLATDPELDADLIHVHWATGLLSDFAEQSLDDGSAFDRIARKVSTPSMSDRHGTEWSDHHRTYVRCRTTRKPPAKRDFVPPTPSFSPKTHYV